MKKTDQMELMFFPSESGLIKVYIYGFKPFGAYGQVFAELNDVTVTAKGYYRKKTIIRTLMMLHHHLVNKEN